MALLDRAAMVLHAAIRGAATLHCAAILGAASLLSVSACGARTDLGIRDGDRDASLPTDARTPSDLDVPRDAPMIRDAFIPRDANLPDAPDLDCLDEPARCDDGDACTLDDCRTDGTCAHAALACDDGDACTDDTCDSALGCTTAPTDCDDRNACTIDACDSVSGCARAPIVCEDADPCTANRCDPLRGCAFPATDCAGCADGTRDAFFDTVRYEVIAACAGGFSNAGLSRAESPTCDRGAGDDGPNPTGRGCSATDLCAPGWHVCVSAADVTMHSPDGCVGVADADPRSFFATRQTGPGCGHCATGTDTSCGSNDCRVGCAQTDRTTNDIFGCGDLGAVPQAASCGVLNRFSNNLCGGLGAPWRCDGDPDGLRESDLVVKPGPAGGGVLCCLD